MTDPIADMLTRIRNAYRSNKDHVDVPASKIKAQIARIMLEGGYIKNAKFIDDGLIGSTDKLPSLYKEHPARNTYFLLPLIHPTQRRELPRALPNACHSCSAPF